MLVISRKLNEKFTLTLPNGEIIMITLGDVQRGNVRLCIDAPRNVIISRNELLENRSRDMGSYKAQ
jgi:carbon storage regulator CsrA